MQLAVDANNNLTVTGNVKYYTTPSGCRYVCPRTYYNFIATWDGQGNFLNQTAGSLPAEPVLFVNGTEYAYAQLGSSTTGATPAATGPFGFLATPASHYTWGAVTVHPPAYVVNAGYIIAPYSSPAVFDIELASDGDLPLNITSTITQVVVSGSYTNGTGTVRSITGSCLAGPVLPGTSCIITVTFDPSTIISTGSPYGYAYNNMTLALASDAGNLPDWFTHFTITGLPVPD